jgi:predicted lipoprotein with Yx(FWY)xxD motif
MTIVLAALAATLLASAGLAQAGGGGSKLQLRKTSAGKILANGRGFTLYMFTKDKANKDNCDASCQRFWPPVMTKGKVARGPGVKKSMIGTIKLANGKKQVTYAKHPLYTYVGDSQPGETSYIGVLASGGRWYALTSAGKAIKHP